MAARFLIAIVLVGLSGFYAHDLGAKRSFSDGTPSLSRLPADFAGWKSEDYSLSESVADVLGADAALHRRYYHQDGSVVWFFVAYFAQQQVNSQIHSPRHCVPGSGWKIISNEQQTVSLPGGPQPTSRMLIERDGMTREMLYWFRTRGGTVTGEYNLKLDLVKNSLARRPTDAAFVRFTAPSTDSKALRDLMAHLDTPLSEVLDEVGLK